MTWHRYVRWLKPAGADNAFGAILIAIVAIVIVDAGHIWMRQIDPRWHSVDYAVLALISTFGVWLAVQTWRDWPSS